jgi:AcrR family transcriptional regulator
VAKARTPRSAWLDAALKAFAAGGPDAVRVEALADSLGVTKGGFYWHFKDREALLSEMLDTWETATTEGVFAEVGTGAGDARAQLRKLFEMAPSANFEIDLAVRDWARRDKDVAKRLRRIDTSRMNWLRGLFSEFARDEEDAGARTMLAYSLLIGAYFIAARPRSQLVELALARLLEEPQ